MINLLYKIKKLVTDVGGFTWIEKVDLASSSLLMSDQFKWELMTEVYVKIG